MSARRKIWEAVATELLDLDEDDFKLLKKKRCCNLAFFYEATSLKRIEELGIPQDGLYFTLEHFQKFILGFKPKEDELPKLTYAEYMAIQPTDVEQKYDEYLQASTETSSPKNSLNRVDRQRRYIATKGESRDQHQPHRYNKQQEGDNTHERSRRNFLESQSDNYRHKNEKSKQEIRNCRNLQELLNLERERRAEIRPFHISFFWNQASSFMKDNTERHKIKKNPGILKPLVRHTLDFSDRLLDPQSLAAMTHAIANISFRTRKPIINASKVWIFLENNTLKAAKLLILVRRIVQIFCGLMPK